MSDDRKQSPHYIPELDPHNKANPGPSKGEGIYFAVFQILFGVGIAYAGIRNDVDWQRIAGLASAAVGFFGFLFVLLYKPRVRGDDD